MLWHSPDALDLVGVLDVESLNATIVQYVPELYHALGVCRDEAVEVG